MKIRLRHRWIMDGIGCDAKKGWGRCVYCRTRREVIAIVGIKYHRELRSYVRSDGVRFTGAAPECNTVRGAI